MRLLLAAAACLGLAACAGPLRLPGSQARPPSVSGGIDDARARGFVAVANRLESVAEAECARRNGPRNERGVNCDLLIVVDDRPGMPPNAFQTVNARGRPILGVTVALIGAVENPDEMAFVLSHEASHHILGHLARQDEVAAVGAEIFGRIAAAEAGATPASIRDAREVGAAVGARSYSKEWELEADALGASIAAQAGFDPLRGADFFLRIPDPGNRFLGTHPSNGERMAVVRAVVEGAVMP